MRAFLHRPVAAAALLLVSSAAWGQSSRPLLAVFAHPDDERVIGPLLSRLSREGREVHLVIATDGSKGVRDHAGIPAGPALAAARKLEAECAAKRLGVRQLHLLGLEDGGLASFANLARLRTELEKIIGGVQPEAIFTFGPEGGTGHPGSPSRGERRDADRAERRSSPNGRSAVCVPSHGAPSQRTPVVARRQRGRRRSIDRSRAGGESGCCRWAGIVRLSPDAVHVAGDGRDQPNVGARVEWSRLPSPVERD